MKKVANTFDFWQWGEEERICGSQHIWKYLIKRGERLRDHIYAAQLFRQFQGKNASRSHTPFHSIPQFC